MPDLKITNNLIIAARQEESTVYVSVRGEVDLHNSPELRGGLLEILEYQKPTKLVLNMSQVPYMDSSAIAVLVESLRKLRTVNGKLYLVALQPRVRGVLELARLHTLFSIVDQEADAGS